MRLRVPTIFLLLVLCLPIFSQETIAYFGRLGWDGSYRLEGFYPLEEEVALSRLSYRVHFDGELRPVLVESLRWGRLAPDTWMGAARMVFRYEGVFEEREFQNARELPQASRDGYAILRIRKNEQGFPVNVFHYDRLGNLMEDPRGATAYGFIPDEQGRRRRILQFDAQGKRIPDNRRVWEELREYNSQGFLASLSFLDENGQPMLSTQGVAGYNYGYDEQGNRNLEEVFDLEGNPTETPMGIFRVTREFDEQGRILSQSFWNDQEEATPGASGPALFIYEYDDLRNWVKRYNYDHTGEIMLDDQGVAVYKEIWHDQGNEREIQYYGIELNPFYLAVSEDKREGEEKYLLGQNTHGVSAIRFLYDDMGNNIERRFYGKDLELTPDQHGISLYRMNFDAKGQLIEEAYYGGYAQRVAGVHGVSQTRWEYNEQGLISAQHHFDISGNLTSDEKGVASYYYQYNEKGQRVQQDNLGTFGQAIEDTNGVASYHWSYDKFSRMIQQQVYGIDHRPTEDIYGIFTRVYRYDDQGRRILDQSFDRAGALLGS